MHPKFLFFSGTESDDDEFALLSDFPAAICRRMFEFFQHGGRENIRRAAEGIEQLLAEREKLLDPVPMPEFGIYKTSVKTAPATVWVCFYRAWLQAGDLEVVDALFSALEERGLRVHGLYSLSLRSSAVQSELLIQAQECPPDVVVMMQSFSACLRNDDQRISFFEELDCPAFASARRPLLQGSMA